MLVLTYYIKSEGLCKLFKIIELKNRTDEG